jgi:hypothetical protein
MATDGELDRVVHQYLQHRNYKVSEWVSRLSVLSCTCEHARTTSFRVARYNRNDRLHTQPSLHRRCTG